MSNFNETLFKCPVDYTDNQLSKAIEDKELKYFNSL